MRRVLALAIVFLFVAGSVSAATFDAVTDAAVLQRAEIVVVATVLGAEPREGTDRMVFTDYRLQVEQVIKGEGVPPILTVSELGGLVHGRGIAVPGSAAYTPATRVLTFLRQRPDGTYYTAYMALGKFRFERREGVELLVRDADARGIETESTDMFAARPAAELIEYLRAGAPKTARRPQGVATDSVPDDAPVTANSAADYALTGGGRPLRWDCPTSCTKKWTVGMPQMGPANTAEAVEDAMAAWTDDPNGFITLQFFGLNTHEAHTNDDINDIIFNTNDGAGFCDSGIGCAVVYFNGPPQDHTFDGDTFNDIVSSDILIRPVAFSQNQLESVLAHELGHGIGFDHAPSAGSLMSPSPASGATLRLYDQQAIAEMYGAGFPCTPVEITSVSGGGSVDFGDTQRLEVEVSGTAPYSYQWFLGEPGDTSHPVGTNSPRYTTPGITEPATYWVKVSNCDGENFDQSDAIVITPRECHEPTIQTQPQSQQQIPVGGTATLSVSANGTSPLSYRWYQANIVGDDSTLIANTREFHTPPLTNTTSYWVRVSNACGDVNSNLATVRVGNACVGATIAAQPGNLTVGVGQGVTLSVTPAGDAPFTFQWFEGDAPSEANPIAGATNATLALPEFEAPGTYKYWVLVANGCGHAHSNTIVITVDCGPMIAPEIAAPQISHHTSGYRVQWTGNIGTSTFELQEATSAAFTTILRTFEVAGSLEQAIAAHSEITTDTRFFYRVRPKSLCTGELGPFSPTTNVLVTVPPPADNRDFSVSFPLTARSPFTQNYLIEGFGDEAHPGDMFAVSTDVPWLTVSPSSGPLPAGGATVVLTVDPTGVDIGSTTGTVIVQRTQGSGKGVAANSTTSSSFPFTVSKVTPVTPEPRSTTAPPGTLLIPAIAHADGIGTRFQSDVRITNASGSLISYLLSWTPTQTNGTTQGKQLSLDIAANETKGLDDVVKAWYGAGVLGELGVGTLEIRPLGGASPLATYASSRTYAVTDKGTLGQYIPAIALDEFISNIASDPLAKISLQQVANSGGYRTNLGFVEGSGQHATIRLTLKDGANNVLRQVERNLQPYGHEQTNFRSVFGDVPLNDGRIEVEVISAGGKATAYASVLDNKTTDPLLVFPEQPLRQTVQRVVVPGVAELNNGASNFHTDMRIYNASSATVPVTLSYFPQGNPGGGPAAVPLTLAPGEVKVLDNILPTLWSLDGSGGAVAVEANADTNLVVTARTYSRDAEGGTYGQFIPGVSAADAVGLNDRALQILQLEQSAQYRTNLGLVEVTGNPVTVRIQGHSAGKVSPTVDVTLQPNEFRQLGRVFEGLGLGTSYTGRVTVQAVGGNGKVAAYGSVVDNRTVDPTYVPAQ